MKHIRLSRFTFHVSRCFLVFLVVATLLAAQAAAFDTIDIPDPNLRIAIREALNLPDEIPITRQEMLRLRRSLRVESQDLKDLTGLEYATNLEDLWIDTGMVSDLTPIATLTALKNLILARNQISDISPLAGLIQLTKLTLWKNEIHDIAPLANLTNLTYLHLAENKVKDITPLANLTALARLKLSYNQIIDLNPLTGLTELTSLDLKHNRITDLNPLAGLTGLIDLNLRNNRISDVKPLANLNALEVLRLNGNRITNITPLIGLENLKKLRIADNPIHDSSPLLQLEGAGLDIDIDLSQLNKLNAVVEVPDPNLRQAIRDVLFLPDGEPLTQFQMLRLTWLRIESPDLSDLTGLEHATNLESISLGGTGMVSDLIPISNLIELRSLNLADNQIQDIRPLANLINLKGLNLWNNQIQDITPLANLTKLTYLNSGGNDLDNLVPLAGLIHLQTLSLSINRIEDITPLVNLTALTKLTLSHNRIIDLNPLAGLTGLTSLNLKNNRISNFSPLANLTNLEVLLINNNFGTDISPLRGLNLIEFNYDAICDIAPYIPSTTERIENRSFPSVFRAWNRLGGLEHKTPDERVALHDLYFSSYYGLEWLRTEAKPISGLSTQVGGNLEHAQETHHRQHQLNPNLVNLISIPWFATASLNLYPSDSEFWLRDENGEIVGNEIPGRWTEYQTDFLHPGFQDLLVKRIVALANCGLFDGIMFDGFRTNATGFPGRYLRSASNEEIIAAMTSILSRVRARARNDFLILVNVNRTKPTAYTEYVNGTFMETGYDYATAYTHAGLVQIESTLLWSEENLREPRINCLEGEGIGSTPPDSPENLQRMRLFTTLSLTHSDGYVLYTTGAGEYGGSDHAHIWHNFWAADLGYPIGPKAQRYQDLPGLFIREFTNGWAVYNRSRKAQTISLPAPATPVSDRGNNAASQTHLLPDLDGEIYLKAKNPADVNGDWVVNILDLVQVANGFGKSAPDPNGDGAVNILDLVFVAQQFN